MKTVFLFFLPFIFQADVYNKIDQPVNENGASFRYHSEIIKQKTKLTVYNLLKNNDRKAPLSITWKAAGLSYIVNRQLSYTDEAPAITDAREIHDPFEYPNTPIFYGNGGDYTYPGSCYIERSKVPQFASFHRTQTVEHRDENGLLVQRFEISSAYNEDMDASIITFDVNGGSNLVFLQPKGTAFQLATNSPNLPNIINQNGWQKLNISSIASVLETLKVANNKKDKYQQSLEDWLNPSEKDRGRSDYVVCKNPSTKPSKLKLICTGSEFEPASLRLVAINTLQQVGTVGFVSDVLVIKQ